MLPIGDVAANAPSKKDVVVAALGASSALAGLVLVFLGVVISQYEELTPGVPPSASTPHRRAVAALLGIFFVGLVSAALALLWLVTGGGSLLYAALVALFFLQLAALFLAALYTTYRVLF